MSEVIRILSAIEQGDPHAAGDGKGALADLQVAFGFHWAEDAMAACEGFFFAKAH